ncbi:acyltransferase [Butyrivibrio sp. AE2032]|uniref:acyltransferase n=1 Tax=Butyrivibrio sp. AE2032 TaxID=1458463 RepID=UPI00163AA68A|nr:acyltransferase [Butyrivibrio sp. AE2032]
MSLLDKAIRKGINYYKNKCEDEILSQLGVSKNRGIKIVHPFFIAHPELVAIGNGTQILAGSRIQLYPELVEEKPHLRIGSGCFFGYRLCILVGADITIGNNVLMASDITIVSENHGTNPESELPYKKQQLKVAPVTIGDNCWIGDKVIILPGTNIGEGCVIGGGAVVTKDIPSYSIAVGNPARVIKRYDFDMHKWVKA